MSQKLLLATGILLGALGAVTVFHAPSLAGDRCRMADPAGDPIKITDRKKNIASAVADGQTVIVVRYDEDKEGKTLAYVTTPGGERRGWAYRNHVACS